MTIEVRGGITSQPGFTFVRLVPPLMWKDVNPSVDILERWRVLNLFGAPLHALPSGMSRILRGPRIRQLTGEPLQRAVAQGEAKLAREIALLSPLLDAPPNGPKLDPLPRIC